MTGAGRRRVRWLVGLAAAALLLLVQVTITGPRVHVRWIEGTTAADRTSAERQFGLTQPEPVDGSSTTWRYELRDRSSDNIAGLLQHPAVADVAYIDRDALRATEGRTVSVALRYPYSDIFDRPADLLRLHRSLWLLLAGGALLAAARMPVARRRQAAVAVLLITGAIAVTAPLDPAFVTMGGSADHLKDRAAFEEWFGGRVRFEKHLAQVTLLNIYESLDADETSPARAMAVMTRLATGWFVLCAIAIGVLDAWSARVLRYLGLVLLAPATLLYFGWRELAYLSLNVAAFPLLVLGLRQASGRLEAGSALTGLGAAFHGSGLVACAGAWLASLAAPGDLRSRADRLLRVTAWATAAYLGWMAIYVIVLKLPISPDPGPAAFSPWRPLWMDDVRLGRTAAAIFSATGARDLAMTAWIVGAPLIPVALSSWRRHPDAARAALWYLPPSLLFVVFRWPFEGVGGGMDLVVAGFPAFHALAWACAQDASRTRVAAALMASAHYAFWRVVLDDAFVP